MAEAIENQVSYIIGYRQSSPDRLTGLQFVLSWLHTWLPEMEIVLVEQDENPVLNIPLPSGCKKYFIYNPGLYNRCWAFNVGVKKATRDVIGFADSDMFMSREDYLKCFEACLTYQAVNPNGNRVVNVSETDSKNLAFKELENRRLWTFAAGIMFMQRTAIEKIGGWDERFEGWGVEDDAISHIIRNVLTNVTLNCSMYHVDHARSAFDGRSQPNYLYNRKIFEEISVLHGLSLMRFLDSSKEDAGNEHKYSSEKTMKPEPVPVFVLSILAGNNVNDLKKNLEGWQQTRTKGALWILIASDGGLSADVSNYLENLDVETAEKIILVHTGESHICRFNKILDRLSELNFDLCFYSDPDIRFNKPGWDILYYNVIKRTGLGHLCFFDEKASAIKPSSLPLERGDLVSKVNAIDIQSVFFTITPALISEVGYLDSNVMGHGKLEFLDYSLRSFRNGFNVINNPFDLKSSSDYLSFEPGASSLEDLDYIHLTDLMESEIKKRWRLLQQPRSYIPANDLIPFIISEKRWVANLRNKDEMMKDQEESRVVSIRKPLNIGTDEIAWITGKRGYRKAVGKIKWKNGPAEVLISLTRKIYNIFFNLRMSFMIRFMDRFSNFLIRTGVAIKKIDDK
jgi:hypothetical protein